MLEVAYILAIEKEQQSQMSESHDRVGPPEQRSISANVSVAQDGSVTGGVNWTGGHEAVAVELAKSGNVEGALRVLNDKPSAFSTLAGLADRNDLG